MDARDATGPHGVGTDARGDIDAMPLPWPALRAVPWAIARSTLHRIGRGEGALLAVNVSLIIHAGLHLPQACARMLLSTLTIALMYAVNDLYDAPLDANNPKKDRRLVEAYVTHRRASAALIVICKLAVLSLAYVWVGPQGTIAAAGAMVVNLVYSTALKGVPVVDVVWCGVWGAAYAAIVTGSPRLLLIVGLMTAVCHLYQALGDRVADAANAITTTAVQSVTLSRNVFAALSLLLYVVLRAPFGDAWAATAFTPLALFFLAPSPHVGWLLTKGYFGLMWLGVLKVMHAPS